MLALHGPFGGPDWLEPQVPPLVTQGAPTWWQLLSFPCLTPHCARWDHLLDNLFAPSTPILERGLCP